MLDSISAHFSSAELVSPPVRISSGTTTDSSSIEVFKNRYSLETLGITVDVTAGVSEMQTEVAILDASKSAKVLAKLRKDGAGKSTNGDNLSRRKELNINHLIKWAIADNRGATAAILLDIALQDSKNEGLDWTMLHVAAASPACSPQLTGLRKAAKLRSEASL